MTKNSETNKRKNKIEKEFHIERFAEQILIELGEIYPDFVWPETLEPRFKGVILRLLAVHAHYGLLDELCAGIRTDANRWIAGALSRLLDIRRDFR